jgi:hypothetical protein
MLIVLDDGCSCNQVWMDLRSVATAVAETAETAEVRQAQVSAEQAACSCTALVVVCRA